MHWGDFKFQFAGTTDMAANELVLGDPLADFEESLAIARKLAAQEPTNVGAQQRVSASLVRIGNTKLRQRDVAPGATVLAKMFEIILKRAARVPVEPLKGTEVTEVAKLQQDDLAGALAAYQEGLDIARKGPAGNSGLVDPLNGIGDAKLRQGDVTGALAAYQEGLDIARKLVAKDPENFEFRRQLSSSLNGIGDAKVQQGDVASALAAYRESLDIRRKLLSPHARSIQAKTDLVISLLKMSTVVDTDQARSLLTEAKSIADSESEAGFQSTLSQTVDSALSKLH
jgi:tetratricopeptide (TPR) repeat protein